MFFPFFVLSVNVLIEGFIFVQLLGSIIYYYTVKCTSHITENVFFFIFSVLCIYFAKMFSEDNDFLFFNSFHVI